MFRSYWFVMTVLGLSFLLQGSLAAHHPLGCRFRPRPSVSARLHLHRSYRPHRRCDPYKVYADLYPKYYGGFHARHFQSYGVPPGDVGLRGNGIQWFAW